MTDASQELVWRVLKARGLARRTERLRLRHFVREPLEP
jgi:hypothetical protein